VKKGKYRSEIENLLRCQGESCPGSVGSQNLIRLLGASSDGQLVFEKLATRGPMLARFSSLEVYKRWILDIIDALDYLHSLGIVHRDLRIDSCLFTPDGSRLVVCDLESRWGQRAAPEIAFDGGLDSGWTTRSDIYDIGNCIKCMVYANAPITNQVEWPLPEPLQSIVNVCMRKVRRTNGRRSLSCDRWPSPFQLAAINAELLFGSRRFGCHIMFPTCRVQDIPGVGTSLMWSLRVPVNRCLMPRMTLAVGLPLWGTPCWARFIRIHRAQQHRCCDGLDIASVPEKALCENIQ
jgi:hypothetical protein